jgi:septum formation protein
MLYLASASPRRAELLSQIGVQFKTVVADIDETVRAGESAENLALRLSREKALKVASMLGNLQRDDLIVGADTLISLDHHILGKPAAPADCCAMLRKLSGREHQVISAIALTNGQGKVAQKCSLNTIRFRVLEDEEIEHYCASGEPMDKAGGYAIQGRAAIFIEHLSGSYSSVMGLPLFETAQLLKQFGYAI